MLDPHFQRGVARGLRESDDPVPSDVPEDLIAAILSAKRGRDWTPALIHRD